MNMNLPYEHLVGYIDHFYFIQWDFTIVLMYNKAYNGMDNYGKPAIHGLQNHFRRRPHSAKGGAN